MRKPLILTSLLALAACGGGGGNGIGGGHPHGASGTPVVGPTFTNGVYTNTESNGNVTQMNTQVIVDENGHVVVPNLSRGGSIRSGSIQDTNGNDYTVYDLSDVNLTVADEVPASLKIGLTEDGAIKDITLSSGGVDSNLARDGTTNQFRGPIFEYVPDGDDRAVYRVVDTGQTLEQLNALLPAAIVTSCDGNCHWNLVDERMDVTTNAHITAGNSNAPVLQYSDFGHFNPVYRSKHEELDDTVLTAIRTYGAQIEAALLAGNDEQLADLLATSGLNRTDLDKYRSNAEFAAKLAQANYQLFAGGYAIENGVVKDTLDAPAGATFTGTGIGRVYTSISANADGTEEAYRAAVLDQYGIAYGGDNPGINDAGHDVTHEFTTSSAQLMVDADGNQTLVMNFPDFYTVTATKTAGEVENVTLTNPSNKVIEKQYMLTGDVDVPNYAGMDTPPTHQVTSNGTPDDPEVMFNPGYYGVGSASEAAGLVRYAQETGDIAVTDVSDPEHPKTFTREFEFQGAYGMKKD